MTNVVIYTRISRPNRPGYKGQFNTETTPTERQAQELRAYYEKQGDTIVEVIEEKLTAASLKENEIDLNQYLSKRPQLKALIDKVRSRQHNFEVLAVWKHDRLARDALFQESLIRLLNGFRVRVFSLYSSNERLARRVQGIVDQEEIEMIRLRTRAGLKARVEAGRVASEPPFGYYSSPKTHKMLPHFKKSRIIIEVFNDYDNDMPLKEVANKFFKGSTARVRKVLGNTTYMGKYIWKEVVIENHHKPIIDKDTFDRVQAKLSREPRRITKALPKHLRHLA